MKISVCLIAFISLFHSSPAQNTPINEFQDSLAYTEYIGGDAALFQFLAANLQYPFDAKEAGIQGLVLSAVIVDTLGNIIDVKILESPHDLLSKEAIRVIYKSNGNWIVPRNENGQALMSWLKIPLSYIIDSGDVHYEELDAIPVPFDIDQLIDPNNLEQTKKNLNEAYRGDPTNSEILYKRGVIYYELKNLKAACKDWKKAAKYGSQAAQGKLEELCMD